MKRALSSIASPKMGLGSTKLRIAILLVAIQVVLSSQRSMLLPIRGYTGHGNKSEHTTQRNNKHPRTNHHHCHRHHSSRSIRIRGGAGRLVGMADALPTIVVEVESFFRDCVLPRARETLERFQPRAQEARERFQQRMDDHRERKAKERQEQLKRIDLWREKAEQSSLSSSEKQGRNRIQNYASSSQLESSRALNSSSSVPRASLKMVLLPSRVLKLSLVAFLLAEVLDRSGVLDGDTPQIVWARIQDFWEYEILRAYANGRSTLEGWYHGRVKWWMMELQIWGAYRERRGEIYNGSSPIWSTIKVTFAISAACGMIATPLLFSWVGRLWRPVLVLAAITETNHYSKSRGRKFVELLGETPQTLGATLDGLMERCRNLVRKVIRKMAAGSNNETEEDWYYEGYGSGSQNSGEIDDRYGDTAVMGLIGGVGRKTETRKRSNGADVYSLGISACHDYMSAASEIELYNRKRRAMAKQGFIMGCALGLVAMKGR